MGMGGQKSDSNCRRTAILEAAAELFGQVGFEGVLAAAAAGHARADDAAAEPPGDRRRAPAPAEGGPVAAPVPPHARVDEADARRSFDDVARGGLI